MDTYDLDIIQGETFQLTITATDDNGSPLNLSGLQVFSEIKNRYSDPSGLASFSGVILTPLSGIINISMDGSGTAALPCTQLIYTVQAVTSGDGRNVVPLLRGYANIFPEIVYGE